MKQHITQTQKTINKWKRDLHTDEIDTKWETVCSQICCIILVKLRSFYFKFIHRALPCNYTLYKMKITQTDYCRFCYNVPETLMHMLWECPYVQKLWKTIWDLISIFIVENIDTEMCNVILCTHKKPNLHLNFHNLKSYIFACKYADKILDPVECWHKIEYY